jgi:DNA polymerase
MKNIREKIAAFLQEYLDVYGEDIFIDPNELKLLPSHSMEAVPPISRPVAATQSEVREPAVAEKSDALLWKFRNQIKDCTKCPLGHTRTTFVFGQGNENADIMFIGEAPGAEEDRTGIPFVGRAGQLLNKLLANIKIDREDVFIANILKCRPPNNRDPQPAEVQECIPYLHKQIELIKPKVIVALGRVAAQNLLNSSSALKQMRERLWQYQGVNMIVTYHPAAILRNMGLLTTATQDFKFILETYQQAIKHES